MSHRISSSRLVVACVVALHCRVSAAPQSQGLQLGLSNAGMQYALSVAVPILEKDASEIPVPDIHGDAGTPVGHVVSPRMVFVSYHNSPSHICTHVHVLVSCMTGIISKHLVQFMGMLLFGRTTTSRVLKLHLQQLEDPVL